MREVNILSTNQRRFLISCFFFFFLILFCWVVVPPHNMAYKSTTPAFSPSSPSFLSLSLPQLLAFLPVYSCSYGVARRSGAGWLGLDLREVVKVKIVVVGLDQLSWRWKMMMMMMTMAVGCRLLFARSGGWGGGGGQLEVCVCVGGRLFTGSDWRAWRSCGGTCPSDRGSLPSTSWGRSCPAPGWGRHAGSPARPPPVDQSRRVPARMWDADESVGGEGEREEKRRRS